MHPRLMCLPQAREVFRRRLGTWQRQVARKGLADVTVGKKENECEGGKPFPDRQQLVNDQPCVGIRPEGDRADVRDGMLMPSLANNARTLDLIRSDRA